MESSVREHYCYLVSVGLSLMHMGFFISSEADKIRGIGMLFLFRKTISITLMLQASGKVVLFFVPTEYLPLE